MIVASNFTAFNVEWGDDSCPYDHLTIEDGDGSTLMEKTKYYQRLFSGTPCESVKFLNSRMLVRISSRNCGLCDLLYFFYLPN